MNDLEDDTFKCKLCLSYGGVVLKKNDNFIVGDDKTCKVINKGEQSEGGAFKC